jgi:carbonic anhydrase/acetyltransferase-like protein (isoleucine patch superfamily)
VLHEYKGKWPKLGERVYIAEGAQIVGDVEIGDHSSVWYNCVIRGDVDVVRIGQHTNIKGGSIGHVMRNECPLILRDYVTIGHGVMLHGCTIESHCLIGMRATIMNHVVVGEYSIVGASALITERRQFPPRSLVLGVPAKVKRSLTDEEAAGIDEYARRLLRVQRDVPGNARRDRAAMIHAKVFCATGPQRTTEYHRGRIDR